VTRLVAAGTRGADGIYRDRGGQPIAARPACSTITT
jgi:hypothetical protein